MNKRKVLEFFSSHGLLLIIILAFAIRMLFFVSLEPWDNEVVDKTIITSDAYEYNELALSLLDNKSFEDFDNFRTPGYPIFIALLYSISSYSVWFVLLIQVFLSIISVLLVFKIALTSFSRKIAMLAAFLFAIDIHQAAYAVKLYSETLFVFLFLVSVYYLCNGIKKNNIYSICLSALILGIATLERPITFLIPLVIILFILVFSNLKLKVKLIYSLLFSAIFITTISPWLLHNYTKYGVAKLTSQSGYNLLFFNVAYTETYKTGKSIYQVEKDFEALAVKKGVDTTKRHSFQNSSIYFNIGEQYIKDNFISYCNRHFIGMINMYTSLGTRSISSIFYSKLTPITLGQWERPNMFKRVIHFFHSTAKGEIYIAIGLSFYLIVNYLFSFYAIFHLIRQKEKFVFLFILIILYFSTITGVIGDARLRIPVMPFINILCALGFLYFYENKINILDKKKTQKNRFQ